MEITIKIQAPELAHAIETLAIAIGCTVDKIGIGEAIKEAVEQVPAKETKDEVKAIAEVKEVTVDTLPLVEPSKSDLTIEQVREAFMSKNSKANTAKLKALLKKYNVAKVTDLPEESFAEVLKDLEAL